MKISFPLLLLLAGPACCLRDHSLFDYFAVQMHQGASQEALNQEAQQIAVKINMTFHGNIGKLSNYFLFSNENSQKSLFKRDLLESHVRVRSLELQIPQQRLFRRQSAFIEPRSPNISAIREQLSIFDPGFSNQWHLVNVKEQGSDLNVSGVWLEGITGKGVIVSFIDDGLEYTHPDLKDNFWAEGSHDYNDHENLPTPKNWDDKHGTRCAGEVAAVRNGVCGVGIAYDAMVAGIRILSGRLTNSDEATAINFGYEKAHIYSCSWGPRDDGKTMDGAPDIVNEAVKNGIEKGRQGLGSIFVFAAGNGGAYGDNW
jgi:kexin